MDSIGFGSIDEDRDFMATEYGLPDEYAHDPAPAILLPDDLLASLDVIRPKSREAEVLTGIPVNDRASARRAASQLLARGAGAAVVQAGAEGNLLVGHGWELFFPRIPVASVDATGAGDAFAAALAVRLAEDTSLQEAATWGSAAAALATTRVGAQAGLPHRAEVLTLLEHGGPGPHTLERGRAHG